MDKSLLSISTVLSYVDKLVLSTVNHMTVDIVWPEQNEQSDNYAELV